jgi:hypothetical protein
MDYPYYSTELRKTKKEAVSLFKKTIEKYIKNTPKLTKVNSTDFKIHSDWMTNQTLNATADYFTEVERVKCRVNWTDSPLHYWRKNKADLQKKFTDIHQLREYIYNSTKVCTNFSIANAIAVVKHFNPKKWLDISAGWGDRLVAAIACQVEYFAVDPNPGLHDKYQDIIQSLDPKNAKKYTLVHSGFEDIDLKKQTFDFVFSSPPFFDFEIYSQDKSDSLVRYANEQDWYRHFLLTSFWKAFKCLDPNGHIVLYVPPKYGDRLVKDTVAKNLHFKGRILLDKNGTLLKNIAFFVWRKSRH